MNSFRNCTSSYLALTAVDDDMRREIHNSFILVSTVLGFIGVKALHELYGVYTYITDLKNTMTNKNQTPKKPQQKQFTGIVPEEGAKAPTLTV